MQSKDAAEVRRACPSPPPTPRSIFLCHFGAFVQTAIMKTVVFSSYTLIT
eukprot:COSAG03_NODE_2155_length_3069_cov_7.379461_1_plen_49_part_10